MKMCNHKGLCCAVCRRLPIVTDEEKRILASGKTLNELMADVYNNYGKESGDGDGLKSINDALDTLESLFSFDSSSTDTPSDDSITREDLSVENLFYIHNDVVNVQFKYNDYVITFCPFCGNTFIIS